jgi:hypothetical protein
MITADPLALDIADDYLTWEKLEPIDYYPSPRRDDVVVSVALAKRRAPTFKELAPSNGAYTASDLVWIVPVAQAPGLKEQFPPRPRDVIEDDDLVAWTILEVQPLGGLKTFWRFITRNLVLAEGLRDTVTIQRPDITTGDSGEPVYTWPPLGGCLLVEDLPARVQPSDSAPQVINGIETAHKRFNVILGQQVEMRVGDRVLVTSGDRVGMYLRWESLTNADRIDELPLLACLRV